MTMPFELNQPSGHRKIKIFLITIFTIFAIPIFLGMVYLAWFGIQGIKSDTAANKFYAAIRRGDDLAPYTCDDNGPVIRYMEGRELVGKITRYKGDFHADKRKRGEPFPEKQFVSSGLTITRGGERYAPEVLVVKEHGKFKVCDVTEIPQ